MHASQLVEIGALVASHGKNLVHGKFPQKQINSDDYWTASKCRLDRWSRTLKLFTEDLDLKDSKHDPWPAIKIVVEEILLSELLTRVWTAVATNFDQIRNTSCFEPIAKSVWIGHLEARNRALTLILRGQEKQISEAVALNRLRRRVERWTDLVLSHLHLEFDVSDFAADPARLRDFTEDLRQEKAEDQASWDILALSLRSAFRVHKGSATANPDLNEQIAAGIMSFFPGDLFEATGVMHSLWLSRLYQTADETQDMIDEYLETH